MATEGLQHTEAPSEEQSNLPSDHALYKKIQQRALEKGAPPLYDVDKGMQVQESLKQWEASKRTLNEIQQRLIQAYQDLDLSRMDK